MLACTENDDQAFGKMIRWEAGRILSKQLARSEEEGKKTDQLVLKGPVSVSLTKHSISQFRTAQVAADIVFIKDKGTTDWTLSEDSRKKLDAADWESDPILRPFE